MISPEQQPPEGGRPAASREEFGILPFRILALSRGQHSHFAALQDVLGLEIIETDQWLPELVRESHADVLLTPSCDWYESAACIHEARRLSIPSVLIMDGIIEWRNEWENPRFGEGGLAPYDQPVITDKIACLGWQTARTLESWGNTGKCELIGAPRFDHYLLEPLQPAQHSGRKRVLVMTANTPGFTHPQVEQVERSLNDLRSYLASQDVWEPIWRVRRGLDTRLALDDNFPQLRGAPLKVALAEADGVLSTPSTVVLESMLSGRPTAIFDYTNSPPYVTAPWMIAAPSQIAQVFEGLAEPAARRMLFQREVLHNSLECFTPALPRMVKLIRCLGTLGRRKREAGEPLDLPVQVVQPDGDGRMAPLVRFELAALYPHHPLLKLQDTVALQLEMIYQQQELRKLREDVRKRQLGYWVGKVVSHAYKALVARRNRRS